MTTYKLMDYSGETPEELGWIEFSDERELVFSDDAIRDLCRQAAADAGGQVPESEPERFLEAVTADLARSSFTRLEKQG